MGQVSEFKELLTIMDIGSEDIDCVFHILDEDGSGGVSPEEFSSQLWKMRSQENRTILMFIKYYVVHIWNKVGCTNEIVEKDLNEASMQIKHNLKDLADQVLQIVKERRLSGMPNPK